MLNLLLAYRLAQLVQPFKPLTVFMVDAPLFISAGCFCLIMPLVSCVSIVCIVMMSASQCSALHLAEADHYEPLLV